MNIEEQDLWFLDKYDKIVYRTSKNGTILSSFPAPGISPEALTRDITDFWIDNVSTPQNRFKLNNNLKNELTALIIRILRSAFDFM